MPNQTPPCSVVAAAGEQARPLDRRFAGPVMRDECLVATERLPVGERDLGDASPAISIELASATSSGVAQRLRLDLSDDESAGAEVTVDRRVR